MQKALWLQERTLLSPASRSTGEAPGPQKKTVDVKVGDQLPDSHSQHPELFYNTQQLFP